MAELRAPPAISAVVEPAAPPTIEPEPAPDAAEPEPAPDAAEPEPAPDAAETSVDVPLPAPSTVLVTVKGIDSELDASGKEYIVFTFALSIGKERVHTIQGRYSELRDRYQHLPRLLAGCPAKFPSKHAGVMGTKDMTGDSDNINLRSRELCEFFNCVLVDRGFQQGEMMTDVYNAMGIEASDSQRLVDAAREVAQHQAKADEDVAAGKKSGWLHKQGAIVKNWKRRWFVLDYPYLRYYASPEDTTPKGEINCSEVTLTEKHAQIKVGREHCFAMYHPDRRTYFLQASNEDQMMRWVQAIRHNSAKVSAIDFEEKALIGQGNFGKVLLVRHKKTNGFYAMKILSKNNLRRQDVEHTKTERSVLQALAGGVKHPFVVKLNFAFQTGAGAAGKLYMVMDYVPGGDLYYHLRRRRRFSEDVVKVWVAELAEAIGYVHSLGIVFRDLKLENLLLDGQGHVHLADFGLSKQVDTAELSSYRLRTFCGTPFYMAPELVRMQRRGRERKGYTKEVDWWAVGVIAFELLTGNPPFNAQSMQELYRKIAEHPIPEVLIELKRNSEPSVQEPMVNLVRDLLARDPDARLGHGEADRDAVRLHPAFQGWCDWDRLLRKEIEPPYQPSISDPTDVSNFDPAFTRRRFLESEALPTTEQLTDDQTNPFDDFTYVDPSKMGSQAEAILDDD